MLDYHIGSAWCIDHSAPIVFADNFMENSDMTNASFVSRIRPISVAAGLLAAASASLAQAPAPNVQLYGLVDVGVTRVSGLAQGTVTQLSSGIMEGSRWGLRGTEDLGNGYKAIFTLESRFEADTGGFSNRPASGGQLPDRVPTAQSLGLVGPLAPAGAVVSGVNQAIGNQLGVNLGNNQFDRQAYVGIITPVGAIMAGRMYTPDYEIAAKYDAMETQSALAAGQLAAIPAGFDIRVNNALQYRIRAAGVEASVMYGFGETGNSSSNSRFVGTMANYTTDSFSVGVGYNQRNNAIGQKALTTTSVGGWAKVGPGKLSAVYSRHKDNNPDLYLLAAQGVVSNLGNTALAGQVPGILAAYRTAFVQKFDLFNVGYRITEGPHTVTVAYTTRNDKTAPDSDARSYGVAYSYALSKRTDLNAVVVRFDNKRNGQAAPGGNGYLGGVTRAAGVDSTSVALGIRHRF